VKLGSLGAVEIRRGMPTSRTTQTGEVAVLSVAALRNGDAPHRFVSRDEMSLSMVDLAQIGDVLLAVEGGTVGECFVVHDGLPPFVPSQQAATLRVTGDVLSFDAVDPWYLAAWLSSHEGRQRLGMLVRGTAIQRIALGDLSSLDVRVPDMDEQKRLGDRYQAFTEAIRHHRSIAADLEVLQRVEFALAFSGEPPGHGAPSKGVTTRATTC
jgi:hypothetical protein